MSRAKTAQEVDRSISYLLQSRRPEKLTALGMHNVFGDPGVEDFIRAACHDGLEAGKPVIELHALEGDGEMLALFSRDP